MRKHSHPKIKYVIVRNMATDTYSVQYVPTSENLSHHESEGEARTAVQRYEAADKRRADHERKVAPREILHRQ
jgi:hypothetical protein